MELYTLGDLYPHPQYRGLKDTAIINISELGYEVAIFWNNIKMNEIDNFTNGPITYGLFEKDKVPFITLEFRGMEFDVGVNALNSNKGLQKLLQGSDSNVMRLYFISAETYRIAGMRMFGMDMDFVNDLKKMVDEQVMAFKEPDNVNNQIRKIWQKINTKQMIRQAKRFRLPGSRGL